MKLICDILFLVGIGLIVAGVFQWSVAAGFVTAGVALMLISGGMAGNPSGRKEDEK